MTDNEWLEEFSDNLISLMEENKMSQEELANESGLSKSAISSYVNGIRKPGVKAIVNISYALDCDIDDLIDFDEMID